MMTGVGYRYEDVTLKRKEVMGTEVITSVDFLQLEGPRMERKMGFEK